MKKLLIVILLSFSFVASAQQLNIALLKYRGGGDWYGNPTSLPNLVRFCNQEIGTDINPNVPTVEPFISMAPPLSDFEMSVHPTTITFSSHEFAAMRSVR